MDIQMLNKIFSSPFHLKEIIANQQKRKSTHSGCFFVLPSKPRGARFELKRSTFQGGFFGFSITDNLVQLICAADDIGIAFAAFGVVSQEITLCRLF